MFHLVFAVGLVCTQPLIGLDRSETAADPYLLEAMERFFSATERFFNGATVLEGIRQDLDDAYQILARVRDDRQRLYWQARVSYIAGFVEQGSGRKDAAKSRFLLSHSLATTALAKGEFSEGYRLQADNYAQLMNYNGLLYKLRYGRKIIELCEKAIELDPDNVKARLTLAISYMFAPPIAGGSLSRSIEMLSALGGAENVESLDRFSINAWLGMAYGKRRDTENARRYIRQALQVFPGNPWMKEYLEQLES